MGSDAVVMVVVGIILLTLVVFGLAQMAKAEQARTDGLFAFAQQRGFQFVGSLHVGGLSTFELLLDREPRQHRALEPLEAFHPFGRGQNRAIENLIAGTEGEVDFYAFDYRFIEQRGKRKATCRYAVVAARIPVALPNLSLSPETMLTRIGQSVGLSEIKVELEAFNRRYFVRCDEERRAYDILHPDMIEFLMRCATRHWQMAGLHIVIAEAGLLSGAYCHGAVHDIAGFVERLPQFVRDDHGFKRVWSSAMDA